MKIDLTRLAGSLKEDLNSVNDAIKEKGGKHFARPIVLGIAIVFGCFHFLYSPIVVKQSSLADRLAAARAVAQFAEQYKLLRDTLAAAYVQLPRPEDREQWLANSLFESLKAENIVADSLPPVTEFEGKGLIVQNANMRSKMSFMDGIRWLHRVESSKPVIHITTVDLSKKGGKIGLLEVSAQISTVIPKKRLGQ
ncbi:MAG: hypothetical protein HY927_11320 [Elusimicrobia bacterium]|nr:hypothetical protein [Elusimicrobiota bacterium]